MKKKLNNVLNQNVNMTTKRARLSAFVISIVDNLCVQQQYKWNTIKVRLPRSIFNVPYGSNFATILDYFISRLKKSGHCRVVICGEVPGSWWRFDCIILFPVMSNLINTYVISNYQYSFGNVFPQICAARKEEKPLGLLALK